jgi:hypothetical protein
MMLCDREKARVARDYSAADVIRDKLLKAGIAIDDRRRVTTNRSCPAAPDRAPAALRRRLRLPAKDCARTLPCCCS